MEMIDLRSDTVTKPTREMRLAMCNAEVGDDGYGEDPTVNKLEELAAQIAGKEEGMFVVSGTMANQVAVMVYARKCETVICDASAHICGSEGGAMAGLSGAQPLPVAGVHGKLTPEMIEDLIKSDRQRIVSRTALIEVENTHNRGAGPTIRRRSWKRSSGWRANTRCPCTWTAPGFSTPRWLRALRSRR